MKPRIGEIGTLVLGTLALLGASVVPGVQVVVPPIRWVGCDVQAAGTGDAVAIRKYDDVGLSWDGWIDEGGCNLDTTSHVDCTSVLRLKQNLPIAEEVHVVVGDPQAEPQETPTNGAHVATQGCLGRVVPAGVTKIVGVFFEDYEFYHDVGVVLCTDTNHDHLCGDAFANERWVAICGGGAMNLQGIVNSLTGLDHVGVFAMGPELMLAKCGGYVGEWTQGEITLAFQ